METFVNIDSIPRKIIGGMKQFNYNAAYVADKNEDNNYLFFKVQLKGLVEALQNFQLETLMMILF